MAEILTPTAVTRLRQYNRGGAVRDVIQMEFDTPVELLSLPDCLLQDSWGNSRRCITAAPNLAEPPFGQVVWLHYPKYPSVGNLTLLILTGDTSIVDAWGNTLTPGEYQIPSAVAGVIAIDCTGSNVDDTVLCDFGEPIILAGTPPYLLTPPANKPAVLPTGVAASTANTVTLQYPANSAPQGQYLAVPYHDPEVTTAGGAFVPQSLVKINPNAPTPIIPLTVTGDDVAHTITITFAEALTLVGIPAYTLTPPLGPPTWPMTGATEAPASTITLDVDPAALTIGGTLTIPPIEPAIRTATGQYVAPATYPIA